MYGDGHDWFRNIMSNHGYLQLNPFLDKAVPSGPIYFVAA